MQFLILGPIEVRADGERVALGSGHQETVLAMLLTDPNRVVPLHRLVEAAWDGESPATARRQVQNTVSALRARLARAGSPGAIVTDGPGYRAVIGRGELDADVFESRVEAAHREAAADRAAAAVNDLRTALDMWRGPALAGITSQAVEAAAVRLNERRLAVLDEYVARCFSLGRHDELLGELAVLIGQHPLHERLTGQFMLALYRSGRQAEALTAFRQLRSRLVDELGVEPGTEVRALHDAILRNDPGLTQTPTGTAAGARPGGRVDGEAAAIPPGAAPAPGQSGPADTAGAGTAGAAGMAQAVATTQAEGMAQEAGTKPAMGTAQAVGAAHAAAGTGAASGEGSLRRPPAQLPGDVPDFTGRAADLHWLDSALLDSGTGRGTVVAAITGTAGVGKTALAVHWAHQAAEQFPDGQLYLNLRGFAQARPLRPIEALAQLLHTLGVGPQQNPVELDEAVGMYRTLMDRKRVLVVLDNAASADQVRPLIPGSASCRVLVTSRDRLSGLIAREGARRLSLDPLTPSEALDLLGRILGGERADAAPQATAELAKVCAYLPLAIRAAATNLANHPHKHIDSYVSELARIGADRLAALEVDGDEDAAVRAAFDLSYRALQPDARRAFCFLGLAPGQDITVPASAALTGTTTDMAGRLLDRLAAAHLIGQHSPGRYRMHDLLRFYAAHQADTEHSRGERDRAVGRLTGWYLAATDSAARTLYPHLLRLPFPPAPGSGSAATLPPPSFPPTPGSGSAAPPLSLAPSPGRDEPADGPPAVFTGHAEALAWLDSERANLIAVVQYASTRGPRPVAWLLGDALRGYFTLRRHMVEWLTVARAALAAAGHDQDPAAQSTARLSLAHAYWSLGRYEESAEHYTEALALAGEAGWAECRATCLGNLGLVYWEMGRLAEAAGYLNEALALDRQTKRLAGVANNLANLGYVYREMGRLTEAAGQCTEALDLYRALGSRGGQANALTNLGQVYHDLGRLDRALELLSQALAAYQEIGDRSNEADTRAACAAVHRDAGRHRQALKEGQAALTLARQIGDRRTEADALNTLASTHQQLGEHHQAQDLHTQALDLARATGTRYQEAEALIGLGACSLDLGAGRDAEDSVRLALDIAEQTGYRRLEEHAREVLARIATRGAARSARDTC